MKQLISILMPALNEAKAIPSVIKSIPLDKFTHMGFDVEILVIDNGSLDGTRELALEAGARVVFEPRQGYGYAYVKGFKEARGSIICTLDADGSYPTEVLPHMVDRLINNDLDFINTDRFEYLSNGAMREMNKRGNIILSFISRLLFQFPFRDSQSGMWIFKAGLLDSMRLCARGMALSEEIKIEAACRLKANCAEYPIIYSSRYGTPKLRPWRDGFANLLYLIRKRLS